MLGENRGQIQVRCCYVSRPHGSFRTEKVNLEKSNLNVEFEPFTLPYDEKNTFIDEPTTSSFVNDSIETPSGKSYEKLNETLNPSKRDSAQSFSLNPEKKSQLRMGNPPQKTQILYQL